ncbi:hypothetical protein BDR26DRAFT_1015216 [Obelidium mucronatum]|nr:hypothetical protein BDR26DRAFT_1015216 [Obelidium mucronatum]
MDEHLCRLCVRVRPLSAEHETDAYRHCLADAETQYAAAAAAAVAEQLQLQQALLLASISYALVYALHSFVATLEGQVCVLKGDPLALLDDSNSYWWLVRCCKTDEIGYIPAENIETPAERIARLNRIRNVQLALVAERDLALGGDFDDDDFELDNQRPTALSFASEPQVFEEYFLGEDYYDDEDGLEDEVLLDDAVSTGSGTEDVSATNVLAGSAASAAEEKQRISTSSSLASVVSEATAAATGTTAITTDAEDPTAMKRSRNNSFWSRLRRNVSNPSIGTPAPAPAAELKPREGRKQGIVDPTTTTSSSSSSPQQVRSSSRNRSPDVTPIQTRVQKPTTTTTPTTTPVPATTTTTTTTTLRVLRIYSGNVDLSASATFKTVGWTQETTVKDLLADTLKRFKVLNPVPGEYYLSVLHFDSQERRLPESETIYKILEQLSSKKLPGLSTSKTVTKLLPSSSTSTKNTQIVINDDQIIKIIVNRNVNIVDEEQDHSRLLRVFMVDSQVEGRTYKTVRVDKEMNVDMLVALAFKKFKIRGDSVGEYRLVTVKAGEETIREPSELIHAILDSDIHEQTDFVFQRTSPNPQQQQPQQQQQQQSETPIDSRSSILASAEELQNPINRMSIASSLNSPILQTPSPRRSSLNPSISSGSQQIVAGNVVTNNSNNNSTAAVPSSHISIAPKNGGLNRQRATTPPLDNSAKLEVSAKRASAIRQTYDDMEKDMEILEKKVVVAGSGTPPMTPPPVVAPAADKA